MPKYKRNPKDYSIQQKECNTNQSKHAIENNPGYTSSRTFVFSTAKLLSHSTPRGIFSMFGSLQDWLVCTPVTSPPLNRCLNNQHTKSSLWFTAWKVSFSDPLLLGLWLGHLACRNAWRSKPCTWGPGSQGEVVTGIPSSTSRAQPRWSETPHQASLESSYHLPISPPWTVINMRTEETLQIQNTVDLLWFTYYSWNKQTFSIIALI